MCVPEDSRMSDKMNFPNEATTAEMGVALVTQ